MRTTKIFLVVFGIFLTLFTSCSSEADRAAYKATMASKKTAALNKEKVESGKSVKVSKEDYDLIFATAKFSVSKNTKWKAEIQGKNEEDDNLEDLRENKEILQKIGFYLSGKMNPFLSDDSSQIVEKEILAKQTHEILERIGKNYVFILKSPKKFTDTMGTIEIVNCFTEIIEKLDKTPEDFGTTSKFLRDCIIFETVTFVTTARQSGNLSYKGKALRAIKDYHIPLNTVGLTESERQKWEQETTHGFDEDRG